ncbi:bile acid:sodium symporter [Parerythrobacter lacustris]|uniref:Bile acid:sodium symporter n=1 Tax=Parerythrobacter lacustris TaxID=2969984 RepID=A0ABT1XQT0_9SPHN|nr:bile acid:sodium symporter [Parerythrobacter lacustris]MCR2834006.1 bile acid:sodium symporter [Parerythrobacter lacustris]
MARVAALFDPMVRLLILAIALAALFPAVDEWLELSRLVSSGGIFLLFLVNGLRIERQQILQGFARLGYFLPLFLWVFGVMALAGLAIAKLSYGIVPPLISLGFLYLGTLPSTVQSATSYTLLANGNAALAVIGAALLNVAGVFITAPLFAMLGGGAVPDVGSDTIMRIALLLVLPLVIGMAVQDWTRGWIDRQRSRLVWLDRVVIALAVYVASSGAVEQGIGSKISPGSWAGLGGFTALFLAFGHWGSWLASGLLRLPTADRIAFLFAGSQKSIAIGAPLAALLIPPEAAGFVIAPLLLYHLLQLVIAAPVSLRLAADSG